MNLNLDQKEIYSQEINLKIATLNTWLIPEYIQLARKTEIRLKEIIEAVRQCEYDILALQEVWLPGLFARNLLNPDSINSKLKYFHYFRSGVMGSGLVTFSKYPIIGTDFLEFSLCSHPFKFRHGDWYGSKGIGVCYISTPVGIISVYNTHLIAKYPNCDYHEHRIVEAFEVVKFIHHSKKGHAILLGDLNVESNALEYQIITKFGALSDLWKDENNVYTFNLPENPFFKPKEDTTRIDYVMLASEDNIKVVDKSIVFERTKSKSLWYSDHSGLHVELELKPFQEYPALEAPDLNLLHEVKDILEKRVKNRHRLANFRTAYFLFSRLFLITFLLITLPIGYIISMFIVDMQWLFSYFLLIVIALLLVIILFLFLFMYSVNGMKELNRLRVEIVRIEMLLQSDRSENVNS